MKVETRGYEVGPSDALLIMMHCIERNQPFMLVGKPGIGKSSLMKKAPEMLGMEAHIEHPSIHQPHNYMGLGMAEGDHAEFLPFGFLYDMFNAREDVFYGFDEVGGAMQSVQLALLPVFWDRELNGRKIPDCVRVGAATNSKEDKAGVSMIVEPFKGRCTIIHLVSSADDWIRWAVDNGMPFDLIAYMKYRPDALNEFVPTTDLTNSPNERNWERVGRTVNEQGMLPDRLLAPKFCGDVGLARGMEYAEWRHVYNDMPNLADIERDPMGAPLPEGKPNVMLATCAGLAYRANAKNVENVFKYVGRFVQQDYIAKMVVDIRERHPELQNTQAFGNMVRKYQHLFI